MPMVASDEVPMNYYRPVAGNPASLLPRDAIIVTEGASTMDISRQVLDNYEPRKRLDAGTWGTMGVGPGFAIAAQVANPDKRVIALEGDAAFGFDGLEVEVAVRHKLPITWIVFNNNGIGGGPSSLPEGAAYPPNAFVPNARYDKVMEAFGGKGYHAETPQEVAGGAAGIVRQRGDDADQRDDQPGRQAPAAAVRLADSRLDRAGRRYWIRSIQVADVPDPVQRGCRVAEDIPHRGQPFALRRIDERHVLGGDCLGTAVQPDALLIDPVPGWP